MLEVADVVPRLQKPDFPITSNVRSFPKRANALGFFVSHMVLPTGRGALETDPPGGSGSLTNEGRVFKSTSREGVVVNAFGRGSSSFAVPSPHRYLSPPVLPATRLVPPPLLGRGFPIVFCDIISASFLHTRFPPRLVLLVLEFSAMHAAAACCLDAPPGRHTCAPLGWGVWFWQSDFGLFEYPTLNEILRGCPVGGSGTPLVQLGGGLGHLRLSDNQRSGATGAPEPGYPAARAHPWHQG